MFGNRHVTLVRWGHQNPESAVETDPVGEKVMAYIRCIRVRERRSPTGTKRFPTPWLDDSPSRSNAKPSSARVADALSIHADMYIDGGGRHHSCIQRVALTSMVLLYK